MNEYVTGFTSGILLSVALITLMKQGIPQQISAIKDPEKLEEIQTALTTQQEIMNIHPKVKQQDLLNHITENCTADELLQLYDAFSKRANVLSNHIYETNTQSLRYATPANLPAVKAECEKKAKTADKLKQISSLPAVTFALPRIITSTTKSNTFLFQMGRGARV